MKLLSKYVEFKNGKKRPTSKGTIPVYGGNGILDYTNTANMQSGALFPELEHQLSYIKYANRNLVNPVTDFTKYEEESASNKQDIGVKQPELEQYILDNFDDQFKDIIGEEDVREVLNIIKEHFTVDWYKRNPMCMWKRESEILIYD